MPFSYTASSYGYCEFCRCFSFGRIESGKCRAYINFNIPNYISTGLLIHRDVGQSWL